MSTSSVSASVECVTRAAYQHSPKYHCLSAILGSITSQTGAGSISLLVSCSSAVVLWEFQEAVPSEMWMLIGLGGHLMHR